MSSQHFKNTARTLANVLDNSGIQYDVYALLNLTDALVGVSFVDPEVPDYSTHEGRVLAALSNAEVLMHLRDGKKINAIKALRSQTLCGLKEAKDAIEDSRVEVHYVRPDGWY